MKPFAIVVSEFNPEVTDGLKKGATDVFTENNEVFETFIAPGAFELPLIAQALAKSRKYSGVVCLGCVIKGDTAHFEYISLGAAIGLQQAALTTGVPISFGILTTYTEEQAQIRSRPGVDNKGREAATACLKTATILSNISG